MKDRVPDTIKLLAHRSFNGEVSSAIRLLCMRHDVSKTTFRVYSAEELGEDDKESIEVATLNFDMGYPGRIDAIETEYFIDTRPLGELDALDYQIFRRKE